MTQITVSGKVGKEPTLKFIEGKNGDFAVANFSIADNQRKQIRGEWVDGVTIWYNIQIKGRQAELVTDQITKGQLVKVTGDYEVTSYEKDGVTKIAHNINNAEVTLHLTDKKVAKEEEIGW